MTRKPPLLNPQERTLWEGAPSWTAVARRVFLVEWVALYFAGLTLADMLVVRAAGLDARAIAAAALPSLATGLASLLILAGLAWAVGRTTRYVLTTERLVLQFGVALPATLSIPLGQVAAVAVRVRGDHTGDVALRLRRGAGLSYLKLWPHARAWRWRVAEPMLRDVPRVAMLAPLLCRALAGPDMHPAEPQPAPVLVSA